MASRDPNDLYGPLRERWEWMRDEWKRRHPDAPQPFLTATFRSLEEQEREFREGQGAPPGQSLHNFDKAYAFDVAFDPNLSDGIGNQLTYIFHWYQLWGELAEEIGLVWGGRWPRLVDGPHVQMPMSWEDARDGNIPELPPLPDAAEDRVRKLVVQLSTGERYVYDIPHEAGIVVRDSRKRNRVYLTVETEETG